MFSSNRAKENGGPTPKRMKTRQNKDSVREMGREVWVGTEAQSKARGYEFGVVVSQGFRGFGRLGTGQEWREMQSRTDPVIALVDVNAEWTEERDSRAPRGAQVTGSSFPRGHQHVQQ